jgi:signal transduction histidine kinase
VASGSSSESTLLSSSPICAQSPRERRKAPWNERPMRTRAAARLAWAVLGVFCGLAAGGMFLVSLNRSVADIAENAVFAAIFLSMGVVGALVASRRPENPIGWILLAGAAGVGLGFFSSEYAYYSLVTKPGSLPGAAWAAWASNWVWLLALSPVVTFLLLLFPDGHLPSRRWRPVAWVSAAIIGMGIFVVPFLPELDAEVAVDNPVGIEALRGVADVLFAIFFPIWIATILASAASLVARFRRARGEEREQIKWFAFAAAITAVWFAVGAVLDFLNVDYSDTVVATLGDMVAFGALPVAAGISILKYRLYDIDIVIRKTVVFGALAAFMTLVYVAIVVGIGALVAGTRSNAFLTIAAAAVIAVAFQPARERARHLANRLVYGKRATPYEMLSEFSGKMAGGIATEDLLPRTARIIGEGTGAARADVWLKVGREIRPSGCWPPDVPPLEAIAASDSDLPPIPGTDGTFAVRHQGELLGALTLSKPRGETLTPAEEKLLADLASQAGLVLRNVRLTAELQANLEELRASRQRIVTAQDEERRRLERNIHDGAQQHLVALSMKLGLARTLVPREPERAHAILEELQAEAQDAMENLRDLARGIYPPLLAEKGLATALEAQARKAALPVEIEADGIGRYPQEIEAAVYFCTLEALQNAAKYSQASRTLIQLAAGRGELTVTIRDDGRGFDPATTPLGAGLTNMSDRLAALGGALEVRSAPGEGTTVIGRIPVSEPARLPASDVP